MASRPRIGLMGDLGGAFEDDGVIGSRATPENKQQLRNRKKVDLDSELPKAYGEMRKALKAAEAKMDSVMAAYTQVTSDLNKVDEDTQSKDRALLAFLRSLQFRAQLGYRWQGCPEFVAWLMPAGSPVPAPGTPAPTVAPGTPRPVLVEQFDKEKAFEKEAETPTGKAATAVDASAAMTPQKAEAPQKPEAAQKAEASSSLSSFVASPAPSAPPSTLSDAERDREWQGKWSLHAFMVEHKRYKVITGDYSDFITRKAMEKTIDGVLELPGTDAYFQTKSTWAKNLKALGEMTTSTSKAVADVTSHLGTKKAEEQRAIKRKAGDEEQAAIKRARDEATATAQAIKKQRQQDANEVKPIFTAEFSDIAGIVKISGDEVVPNWSKPFIRDKSEANDLWAGEVNVQKALTAFGGQYKRTDEAAGTGRTQYPFDDATGLEETARMLEASNMSPPKLVDLSTVAGGKTFQDSAWMFGYTTDMRYSGFGPNCAAMMRWLTLGSFHCLTFELGSLVAYMAKASNQARVMQDSDAAFQDAGDDGSAHAN